MHFIFGISIILIYLKGLGSLLAKGLPLRVEASKLQSLLALHDCKVVTKWVQITGVYASLSSTG
jgi:hypothetical protein